MAELYLPSMNRPIIAEIISIGTEILLGEIIDTNASFIARQLSTRGILVFRKATVGDNLARLSQTLSEALKRADIVITTGGLGPTEDDITREAIAEVFNEKPRVDEKLLHSLKEMFKARGRTMSDANIKQAWLIDSSRPLKNPFGTAFGWFVNKEDKMIFALPGPPSEMKKMWHDQVVDLLPVTNQHFFHTTIHTSGIGESDLAEVISEFTTLANPGIGTYARDNGVDVRVGAVADSVGAAEAIVRPVAFRINELLKDFVYGTDEETIVMAIMKFLKAQNETFACMESVTGGGLAAEITDCPGISACFKGSVTAYTEEVKIKMGVPAETIAEYGVVSQQVAEAMAVAAKKRLAADWGLATTGVAGPEPHGGMNPGVAWVAVAGRDCCESMRLDWPGDREMIRKRVRRIVLQMFWKILRRKQNE